MKRCPQCKSLFPDSDQFCENDGTPLVEEAEPEVSDLVVGLPPSNRTGTVTAVIAAAGIILGVSLVLIYLVVTRKTTPEASTNSPSISIGAPHQSPLRPVQANPVPSASATVEPSPSPSVEPSASPVATPKRELSLGPISTETGATGKTGPVTIKLDSGITIDADEAWQTGEGVWYRKHGVVTLLDPANVKSIDKVPPPTPVTPTTSPSP